MAGSQIEDVEEKPSKQRGHWFKAGVAVAVVAVGVFVVGLVSSQRWIEVEVAYAPTLDLEASELSVIPLVACPRDVELLVEETETEITVIATTWQPRERECERVRENSFREWVPESAFLQLEAPIGDRQIVSRSGPMEPFGACWASGPGERMCPPSESN